MSKLIANWERVKNNPAAISKTLLWSAQILLGSLFLALMARISIPLPFSIVPLSMQPFAVAILAITLGSQRAPWAVACYLIEATMGFPVLAGGLANPLWLIGPKAGYLIGFFFAAYLIAKLLENKKRNQNLFKDWVCILAGETVILSLGWLWLSYYIGFGTAFLTGVLPFIPGAFIKTFAAAATIKPVAWVKSKFS
jgi:biotin transport system substrate-specific component